MRNDRLKIVTADVELKSMLDRIMGAIDAGHIGSEAADNLKSKLRQTIMEWLGEHRRIANFNQPGKIQSRS